MTHDNITQVFVDAATRTPEAIALTKDGRHISYRKLLEEVQSTAAMYQASGIQKGDRLLVFVPMTIDLYRIVLALFYIGAVPVFLDAWVKPSRLLECLKAVPCKGLVAPRQLLWLAWFIGPLRRLQKKFASEKARDAGATTSICDVAARDTALITFTTGSTGTPKAANRTHGFLAAQLEALSPLLPRETTVTMTMLPIVVLIQLALSRRTILPAKKYKAKQSATFRHLYNAMKNEKVALLIASPAAAFELCKYPRAASIRYIITGGGPVSPQLATTLSLQYPEAQLMALYGSTEAEPIAHLDMRYWSHLPGHNGFADGLALGQVDPHTTVAILPISEGPIVIRSRQEWLSMQLPVDAVGEIVVTGAHVLQEYVDNAEAVRLNKINAAGAVWHRTGDAGRLGADGMLYFYGRCSEIISQGGRQLYPLLLDDYLRRSAGAAYTALLLVAGRLVIAIEKGENFAEAKLAQHLAAVELSNAQVIYMKSLPKDPVIKVRSITRSCGLCL